MKKLLLFLILLLLFNCAPSKKHLEGTWYLAELDAQDFEFEMTKFRTFIEFNKDSFQWITFGDLATGDYSKTLVQKGAYKLSRSHLSFKNGSKIKFAVGGFGDSLILRSTKIENYVVVIGQLNPELKYYSTNEDFAGKSFVSEYFHISDSICFINDSIHISTGEYDMNSPVRKWEINYLNGFSFLNLHSAIIPLRMINISENSEMTLIHVAQNQKRIILKPTSSIIDPSGLYGRWKEVEDSSSKPPLPPGVKAGEDILRLEIEADSMSIKYYRRNETWKWDLTNDGKRIYFMDRLFDKEMGTWKIVTLSHDTLVLRIAKNRYAFDKEIFTLKKLQTF